MGFDFALAGGFLDASAVVLPWVKFKELVFTEKRKRKVLDELKECTGKALSEDEMSKIEDNTDSIDKTFEIDEVVTYQELDSIDNPSLYSEDDVVEVFARTNSGGTKLGKSDLLFSLLSASWEVANEMMETHTNEHEKFKQQIRQTESSLRI